MEIILLFLKSALLGIVEGLTEFLPVSSTGHLIIAENLLGFNKLNTQYVEMYTYVIQLGAILAVVVLYWRKILDTLINLFPKKVGYEKSGFKFWLMIVIACIPGTIAQLTLDKLADKYLFNAISVAITLFIGGVAMIFAEKKLRIEKQSENELNVSPRQALVIGLFQCLAIIPGMSRSASTIIGGWVAGLPTVQAAEFSFFLAIPVMFGMSALQLIDSGGFSGLSIAEIGALLIGLGVAFLVALIVVRKFIEYLQKKPMQVFAIYRMIFAVLVLAAGLTGIFKS